MQQGKSVILIKEVTVNIDPCIEDKLRSII